MANNQFALFSLYLVVDAVGDAVHSPHECIGHIGGSAFQNCGIHHRVGMGGAEERETDLHFLSVGRSRGTTHGVTGIDAGYNRTTRAECWGRGGVFTILHNLCQQGVPTLPIVRLFRILGD